MKHKTRFLVLCLSVIALIAFAPMAQAATTAQPVQMTILNSAAQAAITPAPGMVLAKSDLVQFTASAENALLLGQAFRPTTIVAMTSTPADLATSPGAMSFTHSLAGFDPASIVVVGQNRLQVSSQYGRETAMASVSQAIADHLVVNQLALAGPIFTIQRDRPAKQTFLSMIGTRMTSAGFPGQLRS